MKTSHVQADMAPWDEILTTAEVAALVKSPAGTIRSWRHIGEGPPSFKLGPKGVRYRRSAVEAWVTTYELESRRMSKQDSDDVP